MSSLKIIELRAENFKRLKAVEIKPDGSLVVITGRNAQGKSSVLDAIWAALGGRKAVPTKPVREGKDRSEITLDLGDYVVTRVFTEQDTYLTVKNADGASIRNPQSLLDSMIGSISFDPLAFARMKPVEQAFNLAKVAKVDFAELNEEKRALYEKRTDINRDTKRLEAVVVKFKTIMPDITTAKIREEVPVNDLILELECARNTCNGFENDKRRRLEFEIALNEKEEELKALKLRVSQLGTEIVSDKETLEKSDEDMDRRSEKLPDMKAIQQKISEAGAIREHNQTVKDYTKTEQERFDKAKEALGLTEQIEAIEQKKTDLVTAANLPVDNLTFDETGVFYNGIPFSQCCGSEQLRISTALAINLNPKLRVIRINDGSLLDTENLAVLESVAKAQDFQIWIERVGEGAGEIGILIEDGQVIKPREEVKNV